VLGVFIEGRIERLLNQAVVNEAEPDAPQPDHEPEADKPATVEFPPFAMKAGITEQEFRAFLSGEMDLLDNPQAFRAIFG